MTLGELGSLGEIVGALGAVAALAYLALQIRQNTEGLRINSYHQATSDLSRQLEAIYLNAEFAEIFRRGSQDPSSLSEAERARFPAYTAAFYYSYEPLRALREGADRAGEVGECARERPAPLRAPRDRSGRIAPHRHGEPTLPRVSGALRAAPGLT